MRKFPISEISTKDEDNLWQKSLIIFDTSALCRLYSLTDDVRDNMLVIFEVLKSRIWIPHRVLLEFDRHREEELKKPLGMYGKPKFFDKSHISKEVKDYIEKLENESYRHPKVEQKTIDILKEQSKELDSVIERLRVTIEKALKVGKQKIAKSIKNDPIEETINELDSGDCLTIQELRNIISEGHIRYTYRIPPGYEDIGKKFSIDAFGDLIIWKEIIKKAIKDKTSIILVTQDLKEDWSAIESKDSIVPREELLVEFEAETGRKIWMYTISDFLSKLAHYKAGVEALNEPLKNVDRLKMELELASIPDDEIKIKCPECGRIIGFSRESFDWEWNWYGNEDGNGEDPEIVYVCHSDTQCPHCDEILPFTFYAYLYPYNHVNYAECSCEDEELLYTPDLINFISFPDLNIETCCRCGKPSAELNEDGFCQDCMDEFDYECNKDD